jgi:hypothetical protein
MDQLVTKIPPGASPRVLEAVLHEQMHEKQRQINDEGYKLFRSALAHGMTQEEYEAKVAEFLERANEFGKSTLAEYVAHRKVILDFLEMSLQSNPETGKYRLEETVHNLIYPMRKTSDEVPYQQQNLWIIDERLSYHRFLASDKRLSAIGDIVSSPSASRPDLLIFDRALSFTESESGPLSSMVVVEFKRPDRTSYSKDDPIDQAYGLVREIRSGHFHDHNGREIKVQSSTILAYVYVICDTTKPIEESAINKGFFRTPDNLGFYFFNSGLSAYVEIIPYDKLLNDAKKRNRILFDKLNLPMSST